MTIPESFDTSKSYIWFNEDWQRGTVQISGGKLSFWAPHFSEYTICQGTVVRKGPAPSAASTSIIKGTGADLNLTAVVVAGLALVLTAGCAVVGKKRILSK